MTNMDDQVAKHIRQMIMRATQRATDEQKPRSMEEIRLYRTVALLKEGSTLSYDRRSRTTKP
jgi:hypothetical protein